MEGWLGLIGALAGTAIGGLVTYKVAAQQNTYARHIEAQRRKIEAMESIYELLSSLASFGSTLNMGVIGDLGYNVPFKADFLKEKVQFDRLRMLIDFYAPALKPKIKEMGVQFGVIARAITEVLLQKDRNDEWKTNTVKSATLASIKMQQLANEAQEMLSEQVQALNAES